MIKTAVIEDNGRMQNEVVEMIRVIPGFVLEGIANSVPEGITLILTRRPDLVLMDIALEEGSAFDILEATRHLNYKIIFLTAYEEYAIRAIKYGALDYLVKPLNESEFREALIKVSKEHSYKEQVAVALEAHTQAKPQTRLVIRTNNHFQIVNLEEIIYCHSDSGYTTFFMTSGRTILTSKYLKEYEDILSDALFLRPHQSYMVNKHFIEFYDPDGWLILKDKSTIPVAHRKRELIMDFLKGKM